MRASKDPGGKKELCNSRCAGKKGRLQTKVTRGRSVVDLNFGGKMITVLQIQNWGGAATKESRLRQINNQTKTKELHRGKWQRRL